MPRIHYVSGIIVVYNVYETYGNLLWNLYLFLLQKNFVWVWIWVMQQPDQDATRDVDYAHVIPLDI